VAVVAKDMGEDKQLTKVEEKIGANRGECLKSIDAQLIFY
jgi:hypothetical protein